MQFAGRLLALDKNFALAPGGNTASEDLVAITRPAFFKVYASGETVRNFVGNIDLQLVLRLEAVPGQHVLHVKVPMAPVRPAANGSKNQEWWPRR